MHVVRFVLELETPLHCGGDDDILLDMPVSRDAFGFWRIPGSSVAGILRAWVRSARPGMETALFGSEGGDGRASRVWCDDALLLDYDGEPAVWKQLRGKRVDVPTAACVRDHVRLDLRRGAGVEGGKFDEEIVPPGVRFALEVRLDAAGDPDEAGQTEAFLALCGAVAGGAVRFGGKTGSGYGRTRALQAECRMFDLGTEAGLTSWLNLAPGVGFRAGEGTPVVLPEGVPVRSSTDGISGVLVLPLETRGPVVVGGKGLDVEADIEFLRTPVYDYGRKTFTDRPTIPGTSVRGVVRHRVHMIALTLGLDADALVDSVFGTIAADGSGKGAAGKVSFDDVYLDADTTHVPHVAIDRFTGGTLAGALFDEAPVWKDGARIDLRMEAEGLTSTEAKVLLHALVDLASGDVPVGNGGNRGNGSLVLRGLKEKEWAGALAGVTVSASWNGDGFDGKDGAKALKWLERIEEGV